jgi:UDP-glucuronate 4-epimerase
MKKILITGCAGFIGYHLVKSIVEKISDQYSVVGLDNINDYYDINLKLARMKEHGINSCDIKDNRFIQSSIYSNYKFIKTDIEDRESLLKIFKTEKFDYICNLAARAGVRYSIDFPEEYIDSNIHGFLNILECCRLNDIKHLLFASSSSVYGLNSKIPFSVHDHAVHPISPYAATKKANELISHTYSYLYRLPVTGIRFFTVYGSWGRPDMAPFKFTKNIIEGKEITVYNKGNMYRDFTHVSDIINGIIRVLPCIPKKRKNWDGNNPDPASSPKAPYKLYNLGYGSPIKLIDFIKTLEEIIGIRSKIIFKPMIKGDVLITYANTSELQTKINYRPSVTLKHGLKEMVSWYKKFY